MCHRNWRGAGTLISPLLAATDLGLYLDDRTEPLPPLKDPPKRIVLFIGP